MSRDHYESRDELAKDIQEARSGAQQIANELESLQIYRPWVDSDEGVSRAAIETGGPLDRLLKALDAADCALEAFKRSVGR